MKEEWKLVLCQECSLALNLHSKLGVEHMKKGRDLKSLAHIVFVYLCSQWERQPVGTVFTACEEKGRKDLKVKAHE